MTTRSWSFTPKGRRPRQARRNDRTKSKDEMEPWLRATLNAIRPKDSFLVLTTSASSANADRRILDDQLAEIAVMQATIADNTMMGKEVNALSDEVGFPPYTFSKVENFFSGNTVQMAQMWEEEGMDTLLPIKIFTPNSEDERRQAVLYGVGDLEELVDLERTFLEFFDPSFHAVSFSEGKKNEWNEMQATKFFVQWELTPEEAAAALGLQTDSPGFGEVMNQLQLMSEESQKPQNGVTKQKTYDVENLVVNEGWPSLDRYKS